VIYRRWTVPKPKKKITLQLNTVGSRTVACGVSSAVSPNDPRTGPMQADTLFFKLCTTLHNYCSVNSYPANVENMLSS
jgi:hypothetical protein